MEEISITWLDDYYQKILRENDEIIYNKEDILRFLNKKVEEEKRKENVKILEKITQTYCKRLEYIKK